VRGYTLHQLRTFSEAAGRTEHRARVCRLIDLRASQFESKDFEDYLRRLDG
jgi:hypothetical protein